MTQIAENTLLRGPVAPMAAEAQAAWHDAILGARRLPSHVAHLQFEYPQHFDAALALARRVRDGLGQRAGEAVLHLAVAEPDGDRKGHHLHVLYWAPTPAFATVIRERWERRSRSSDVYVLVPSDREPRGREWTVERAVTYVTKLLPRLPDAWDVSTGLLERVGAPGDRFAALEAA